LHVIGSWISLDAPVELERRGARGTLKRGSVAATAGTVRRVLGEPTKQERNAPAPQSNRLAWLNLAAGFNARMTGH